MEETLTDCLVRMREDMSQWKRVREYLDSNPESQGSCSVTWRTIEAFNSILAVCSSQNTPEIDAMDTLLDSFYFLARNNDEATVWTNFGFELGMICVKILSVIEQTSQFDVLFCKLLTVISVISEHGADVWKATARQILNVFINKNLPFDIFETVLKLYIRILRQIDPQTLYNFSVQNEHLLQTLSMFVFKVGDFETQQDITELVFLHLLNENKSLEGFFTKTNDETKKFLQSLHFEDFEEDSRLFLNYLNKHRVGLERKVYSISCHVLYLGGIFVEPSPNRKSIWVDANKASERLRIKCAGLREDVQRVIYIRFREIQTVHLEAENPDGNFCITIKTVNLTEISQNVKNDDILCVALEQDNTREEILDFVHFLEHVTGGKTKNRKTCAKVSKTKDSLFIDKTFAEDPGYGPKEEVQDSAISSSVKSGLLRMNSKKAPLEVPNTQEKPVSPFQNTSKRDFVLETQELTPNSFLESLNKHLGMDSPKVRHSFEDSVETVKFLQKKNHKLFRSPETIFTLLESDSKPNFLFGESKENELPVPPTVVSERVLRDRKVLATKLTNVESQDYFRETTNSKNKKKPSLPKLNRKKSNNRKPEALVKYSEVKVQNKSEGKPSLLDPNGYAYQRWMKPTTSERSNFWLKKLTAMEKQKEADCVFDFSDGSDDGSKKTARKARTAKRTKKVPIKQRIQKLEMKMVSESKGPKMTVEGKPRISDQKKAPENAEEKKTTKPCQEVNEKNPESQSFVVEEQPLDEMEKPEQTEPEPEEEFESLLSSDDDQPTGNNKRELSHSENSSTRNVLRKKRRTRRCPSNPILSVIRLRLRKSEEKTRRQTDRIIESVTRATNHIFNHVLRKEGEKMASYLKAAEETAFALREMNDLEARARRTRRMLAYFQAGCSLSGFWDAIDGCLSGAKENAKGFAGKETAWKDVDRIVGRLKALIEGEIDRSFKVDMESNRNRLLRCLDAGSDEEP